MTHRRTAGHATALGKRQPQDGHSQPQPPAPQGRSGKQSEGSHRDKRETEGTGKLHLVLKDHPEPGKLPTPPPLCAALRTGTAPPPASPPRRPAPLDAPPIAGPHRARKGARKGVPAPVACGDYARQRKFLF